MSSKHESSFHWFSSKTSDRTRHGNAINGFWTTTAEIYCLNTTTTPFTFSTKLKKLGFHVLFLQTTAEKWPGVCIPTWSGCILKLSLLFCNVYASICPFPLVGSQLFVRGMNLDWPIRVLSGMWPSRVSSSRGCRTQFTPGGLLYGRIIFKPSTTKNGCVITLELEALYKGKFTWVYGNMIFMMFCCSPSWREGFLWSWYTENNCENGANWPAFHFVLREEQRRREIAENGLELSSNHAQDAMTTSHWGGLVLF